MTPERLAELEEHYSQRTHGHGARPAGARDVLELVAALRAERRQCITDVCDLCRAGDVPIREQWQTGPVWLHRPALHGARDCMCPAGAIHERARKERIDV